VDFELTEARKLLKANVHDFAAEELEPIAASVDAEARFPAESVRKMAQMGLTGLGIPREFGGAGGGKTELVIAVEEISRVCASTAMILFVSTGLAGYTLFTYGSGEQRKRFVTPVAAAQKLAAFALTEANAGSDVAALETTAVRHKNGYLLNGRKNFVSNGSEADIVVVFATLDKALKHKGITAFIIEKGADGFSVGKQENKLGVRGCSTTELVFENCFVPDTNRLGSEGGGFTIAMDAIDGSRIAVAAQAVGIAQGALDKSLAYAKERRQFGQPIVNNQSIQWMLADMATRIDAARLLTYRSACFKDLGLPYIKEASMAKVFASETAVWVTTQAVQIFGGYGYTKDCPVERYYRDAKVTEIIEGTSEMQRMTIARYLTREG
jgi:butyryl-CoA dehydrogenase